MSPLKWSFLENLFCVVGTLNQLPRLLLGKTSCVKVEAFTHRKAPTQPLGPLHRSLRGWGHLSQDFTRSKPLSALYHRDTCWKSLVSQAPMPHFQGPLVVDSLSVCPHGDSVHSKGADQCCTSVSPAFTGAIWTRNQEKQN